MKRERNLSSGKRHQARNIRNAAPLNVTDVSLEYARHLIPASLYLLLSLMITSDITDKTDEREGLQSRCAPSQILNGSILPLIEAGIP